MTECEKQNQRIAERDGVSRAMGEILLEYYRDAVSLLPDDTLEKELHKAKLKSMDAMHKRVVNMTKEIWEWYDNPPPEKLRGY